MNVISRARQRARGRKEWRESRSDGKGKEEAKGRGDESKTKKGKQKHTKGASLHIRRCAVVSVYHRGEACEASCMPLYQRFEAIMMSDLGGNVGGKTS